MSLPVQIDHVQQGIDRLLEQFKSANNLKGFLEAWLKQSDELEVTLFDLLNQRGISTAVGAQLDVIGALMGVGREGRPDSAYRTAILNKITLNGSDGTTEIFMQGLRTHTGGNWVDFWEHPSGDVHALLGDGYYINSWEELENTVPAGVNLRIYIDDEFDSFQGSEILQTVSDLQTNNLEDLQVDDGTTVYDLQVQTQTIDTAFDILSVLPEISDTIETPYFAELLFTKIRTTTGNIIDDGGNFLVNEVVDNIIWVDYNF